MLQATFVIGDVCCGPHWLGFHLDVQDNWLSTLWNAICLCGFKNITWCKTLFCLRDLIFIMTKIKTNRLLTLYLYVKLPTSNMAWARSHLPMVGPRPQHASFTARMKPMLPAWLQKINFPLNSWRPLVHITHIECTSSSTSKIQYVFSISLSK
jgi:hypothetical protein